MLDLTAFISHPLSIVPLKGQSIFLTLEFDNRGEKRNILSLPQRFWVIYLSRCCPKTNKAAVLELLLERELMGY